MAESGIYNPRQILCVSEPSRFVLSESGEIPIKCGSAILVIQVCIKIDGCAAPILQFFSFFILNLLTMHRFFGLWIRWFQWKCYFSNIWLSNAIHKISFITKGFLPHRSVLFRIFIRPSANIMRMRSRSPATNRFTNEAWKRAEFRRSPSVSRQSVSYTHLTLPTILLV